MAQCFALLLPDGSASSAAMWEIPASHSWSPKGGFNHTRNSIKKYILGDLGRNSVPMPFKNVSASGYFMDPIRGGGHAVAPEGYPKDDFLMHIVRPEAGVNLQDSVTKGMSGKPRTHLLLVDSVGAPFAATSKSRANAAKWGIPVMCYAQYLATYYYLRAPAIAAPALPHALPPALPPALLHAPLPALPPATPAMEDDVATVAGSSEDDVSTVAVEE